MLKNRRSNAPRVLEAYLLKELRSNEPPVLEAYLLKELQVQRTGTYCDSHRVIAFVTSGSPIGLKELMFQYTSSGSILAERTSNVGDVNDRPAAHQERQSGWRQFPNIAGFVGLLAG